MMKVKNRWNNRFYKVILLTDKEVTLQRENGSKFTIAKSEYSFSYIEVK